MIATISGKWFPYDRNDRHWVATIAEIEKKSISAIVVATIAVIAMIALKRGFHMIATIANPFFSDHSDCSDYMETSLLKGVMD